MENSFESYEWPVCVLSHWSVYIQSSYKIMTLCVSMYFQRKENEKKLEELRTFAKDAREKMEALV